MVLKELRAQLILGVDDFLRREGARRLAGRLSQTLLLELDGDGADERGGGRDCAHHAVPRGLAL